MIKKMFPSFLACSIAAVAGDESVDSLDNTSFLSQKSYLMSDDNASRERLDLLSWAYDPLSQRFLECCDIPKNARILDVGCGAGKLSMWMAKNLVPDGSVVAVDMSESHIRAADQEKIKQGVSNIEFKCLDLNDAEFRPEFDLVTSRYLLMHLKDPKAAILKMMTALKPGGLMALGEGAHYKVRAEPHSEVVAKTIELSRGVAKSLGVNYDIALVQNEILKECGFEIVNTDVHDTEVFGRAKHLLALGVEEAAPRLLAAKAFDEATVKSFIDGLRKVADDTDSRMFMYEFHQVLARKQS